MHNLIEFIYSIYIFNLNQVKKNIEKYKYKLNLDLLLKFLQKKNILFKLTLSKNYSNFTFYKTP